MTARADTAVTSESRSPGERLDANLRGCTGELLILRRQRQAPTHGQLEVARVIGCEAPLACDRQYVPERAPRQVRVDADVEFVENSEKFDRACLRDAPVLLGAKQNVPNFQRPQRRNVTRGGGQAIEQPPGRRRAFVIETPGDRHRGVEYKARQRLPSSRKPFHDNRPSVWPLANSLARAIGLPAPVRRGDPAGTSRATAMPRRVITTSTPRATSSSSALRGVLASNVPISFMAAPLTSQITSLSKITRLRADEVIQG